MRQHETGDGAHEMRVEIDGIDADRQHHAGHDHRRDQQGTKQAAGTGCSAGDAERGERSDHGRDHRNDQRDDQRIGETRRPVGIGEEVAVPLPGETDRREGQRLVAVERHRDDDQRRRQQQHGDEQAEQAEENAREGGHRAQASLRLLVCFWRISGAAIASSRKVATSSTTPMAPPRPQLSRLSTWFCTSDDSMVLRGPPRSAGVM